MMNFHDLVAPTAPKKIVLRIRGDGRQRHFRFVPNPATGALEVPADLRAEIADALMAEMRRFQLRLYLHLAQLYLLKLRLQAQCALQKVVGYLKGDLL